MAESGRSFDASSISLIDACRKAGLGTAGSGYKIWETQEAFRLDLQRFALAQDEGAPTAGEQLIDTVPDLGETPPLSEMIRVAAAVNARKLIGSEEFHKTVALWLAASDDPALRETRITSQRDALDSLAEVYRGVLELYGLEMRPPFTVEMLTLAIASEVHGLGFFCAYVDDVGVGDIERPTAPGGAAQRWHLLGCVVEALFDAFTRPAATEVT